MLEVLVCEKCGLIYPETYDGLTCRNPECGGELKSVRIFFPTEGETLNQSEEPPIAS